MEQIKSGKELCDEFFTDLPQREDIDSRVANLIKDLYDNGQLTKEKILKGLESLRQERENEQQSQT